MEYLEVKNMNEDHLEALLAAVRAELDVARVVHGPIASYHEGLAVLREEYLEAERAIFARHQRPAAIRGELIQVAAMALRTILDREACAREARDA